MRYRICSPWLSIWLVLVLGAGLLFSYAQKQDDSLVSGQSLLVVGLALIFAAGIIGSARTSKWFTWDGPVIPSRAEWAIGLTGAALFLSPLLHVLLMFLGSYFFGQDV
jgi:hypothetical protein